MQVEDAQKENLSQSLLKDQKALRTGSIQNSKLRSINKSIQYVEYSYKWAILIMFYLTSFLNGIPYETCVPISKELNYIYGVSDSLISFSATGYVLMHPLFSFPASKLIVTKGWAFSVKFGIILNVIGVTLRLLVNKNFYTVLIGQLICGIARPFILNCQTSMAQNWFFPSRRNFVLNGQNILHTFSIIVSLLIPSPLVFGRYKIQDTLENIDEGRNLTFNLMAYEFYIVVPMLLFIPFLKTDAPTPPSSLANSDKPIPVKEALSALFSKKDFLLTFIPYSVNFGFLKAFGIIIPFFLEPFDFTSAQKSYTSSFPIVGGVVSSLGISFIVMRFKRYKIIASILMTFTAFFCALFYFAALSRSKIFVYTVAFFIGFFLTPQVPVMLELSCEIIYPISGSFALGTMYSGSTLMSFISGQSLTLIIGGNQGTEASTLVGIICIVTPLIIVLIAFQFVKEVHNKTAEAKSRSIKKSSLFVPQIKQSILNQQLNAQKKESIYEDYGEYPTYIPGAMDKFKYVENKEVFMPEYTDEINEVDSNSNDTNQNSDYEQVREA